MKTIKSIATTLALIATLATANVSACSDTIIADTLYTPAPTKELDPISLADFMGNQYANSFCNFRIVTNAHMEDLNTVIVGEDTFLLADWGFYSETSEVTVLFNTRGTADVTDDIIISVYESPADDDSAEIALYENLYNDMWNLR